MSERLEIARGQIEFARRYTLRTLDATPADLWFSTPPAGVSTIHWQVGHLAMAEYRLALERIRGTLPKDEDLISTEFLIAFGRDSQPLGEAVRRWSAEEVRAVFDRVHAEAVRFLETVSDAALDLPPHKPHSLCGTRLECLRWCAQHEGVHAGQIGLLRRQLGRPPWW